MPITVCTSQTRSKTSRTSTFYWSIYQAVNYTIWLSNRLSSKKDQSWSSTQPKSFPLLNICTDKTLCSETWSRRMFCSMLRDTSDLLILVSASSYSDLVRGASLTVAHRATRRRKSCCLDRAQATTPKKLTFGVSASCFAIWLEASHRSVGSKKWPMSFTTSLSLRSKLSKTSCKVVCFCPKTCLRSAKTSWKAF